MSYDSVDGVEKLRATAEWKDYIYDMRQKKNMLVAEQEKEADFATIRTLHAKHAEVLMKNKFTRANGTTFYILEDDILRTNLNELIGQIAASHHWNINRVAKLSTQLNSLPGYPRDWRINPQKLACIIRCADAGHIDAGRAPDHLYRILRVNGVSRDHWKAQNMLAMVDIDQDNNARAIINSIRNFKEEDFSAKSIFSSLANLMIPSLA